MKNNFYKLVGLSFFMIFFSAFTFANPLLNGLASYQDLGGEMFIAALYAENPTSSSNMLLDSKEKKSMELRITADRYSARRLNKMWIEGMAINNPGSVLTEQAQNMIEFTNMIKKKLMAGDILTIENVPGEGTDVSVNGVKLGTIKAEDFFSMLLRTWIGSIPLSSDFRRELLQKGKIDNALLTRYKALKPAAERVAVVKSWIESPEPKQEPKPENQSTPPEIPEPTIAPAATPKIAATQAQPQSPPSGETSSVETPYVEKPSVEKPKSQGKAMPRVEARPVQVTLANAFPKHEITEEANLKREEEMEELTAESLISQQLYHAKLLKWTYQHLRYPPKAHKRRQEGHVRLSVTISRTGKLEAINVISESSYALLNNEAINAVKESSPYPSMPEDVRGRQFEFSIPIEFRL